MKAVRCKNKQCGAKIAYINGKHRELECPKCGTSFAVELNVTAKSVEVPKMPNGEVSHGSGPVAT